MQRRPCKYGLTCGDFAKGNCRFGHDPSEGGMVLQNPFNKPKFQKTQGFGGGGGFGGAGFGGPGSLGGPGRQCNKGINCFHWKQGTCKFSHPQPYQPVPGVEAPVQHQGGMGGGMNQGGHQGGQQGGFQGGNQGVGQGGMNQGNMYQQGGMNQGQHQGQGQGQGQGQNYNQGHQGQNGKCKYGSDCNRNKQGKCPLDHSGPKMPQTQLYCKFWQKGSCQKQNCNRRHAFSIDGSVQRVYYTDAFPTHPKSGIGSMTMETNHYLIPIMGNQVYSLLYPAGAEDVQGQDFNLQVQDIVYRSKVEGGWILMAYEKNKFQNIHIFNIQTGQNFLVEKAHQRLITGLTMFDNACFLSSSMDSQNPIKVWRLQGEQFVINLEKTKEMNGQINNPKAQIKFVKCIVFGGSRCICAGTSDSRVLLWKDGQFGQISIPPTPQSFEIVFDFDIQMLSQHPCGFILIWTTSKLLAGIFIVNLNNLQNVIPFHNQSSPIYKMVVTPNWLITSNTSNQVNFYRLQLTQEGPKVIKAGTAAFDNIISEILYLQATTPTLINMKNVLVMESCREGLNPNDQANKGSVSIFKID